MLIAITEHNAWENEKWMYVLDLDKQDGEVINCLMIFIRMANEEFDKIKNSTTHRLFAASRYTFKFYNELDLSKNQAHLRNKTLGAGLVLNGNSAYQSNSFDLNLIISSKRMKSAMLSMRDKKDNIIYKSFQSLFMKTKQVNKTNE